MQYYQIEAHRFIDNHTGGKKLLGEVFLDMQRQFPPFNFYYNKPDGMSRNVYLQLYKPVPFNNYLEYGQVKR